MSMRQQVLTTIGVSLEESLDESRLAYTVVLYRFASARVASEKPSGYTDIQGEPLTGPKTL